MWHSFVIRSHSPRVCSREQSDNSFFVIPTSWMKDINAWYGFYRIDPTKACSISEQLSTGTSTNGFLGGKQGISIFSGIRLGKSHITLARSEAKLEIPLDIPHTCLSYGL